MGCEVLFPRKSPSWGAGHRMSRQEPLHKEQRGSVQTRLLLLLRKWAPGWELPSYFHPERAFVRPGPRAWPYRIPSVSLPMPPKPEGTVLLPCPNNIYLLPLLRGPQNTSLALLDKLQMLWVTLGLSFPLPAPQFCLPGPQGDGSTLAEGRGHFLPLEPHPSRVRLDAVTSWGPGRAQTAP